MPTIDYAGLSDFNFQDPTFVATLQADLVDALKFYSSGAMGEIPNLTGTETGNHVEFAQYETIAGGMTQSIAGTANDVEDFGDYINRAARITRHKTIGVDNFVNNIAGKDPMSEISRQVANVTAKEMQKSAIKMLQGIYTTAASALSTGSEFNSGVISSPAVLGAKQLLGDAQSKLTAALMNSKVWTDAVGLGLTQTGTLVANDVYRSGIVGKLLGMDAYADDTLESNGGVYPTYFLAKNAIGYKMFRWVRRNAMGELVTSPGIDIEFMRDANTGAGRDAIIIRISYIVHFNGFAFNSSVSNPTDAQLATDTNWTLTADDVKKINGVQLLTL